MVKIKEDEVAEVVERKKGGSGVIIFILLLLLAGAMGGFVWSYKNYREAKQKIVDLSSAEGQQKVVQKEVDDIVERVRRHIVLPENETPMVATIEKADELAKSQPFYQGSSNGDKVLIYQQAAKAIIYNLAKDILVNVGPVFMDNSTDTTTDSATETSAKISVEFRNGTDVAGLARVRAEEIDNNLFSIEKISEAKDKKYAETVIVNLKNLDVSSLEAKYGVKAITILPEGEVSSTADVVVIVAK